MRINESKNRRFFIMEQISEREHSRQRFRKSSAERRRKIEQSLGDFMKTMSDVSYRQTGGSEGFRVNKMMNEQGRLHSQLSPRRKLVEAEYNEAMNSPSFQDIKFIDETEEKAIIEKDQHNDDVKQTGAQAASGQPANKQVNNNNPLQQQQFEQAMIADEQIVYDNNKQIQIIGRSTMIQNNVSIASSTSGIFFTSQFNDFINQNHLQPIPQVVHHSVGESQQLEQINPKKEHHQQEGSFINVNNDNEGDKEQSPELAIDSNNKPPQQQQKLSQDVKQANHEQLINQTSHDKEQRFNVISNNKSTHSLAFSNQQSSLKFSLNESNIKTLINQKFAHQLVLNSNQFSSNEQQPSLFFHLKLQIIVEKFHAHVCESTINDLKAFFKIYYLSQRVIKRQKKTAFQAFIINQQLNLLDKKNQIKCQQFINNKQHLRSQTIFHTLKQHCFTLPKQQLQLAKRHYNQKQHQQTEKIFRCLKIVWFDQKVKKQIDLYYLSKLFAHFSRVVKNEKQQNRKKYLSFYCFNLKKRYFTLLKQGVEKTQMQRIQRDNSNSHYSFVLMRKVFDAWRDRLAYKDRYISLAMTTRNTFKETSDQRWMQIKTVDFRQIK